MSEPEPSTILPELATFTPGEGVRLVNRVAADGLTEIELTVEPGARLTVRFETGLRDAVGYWHPAQGAIRTLPADWAGHTATSLISSAPVGCLFDASGRAVFALGVGMLVSELDIRFGVSEEHKTFALEVHGAAREVAWSTRLALVGHGGVATEVIGVLARWLSSHAAGSPLPVPDVARRPVYSTWYTFTQDVDSAAVLAEAERAARLGCGSVFIDDGWQRLAHGRRYRGCGDWLPDPDKFGDLAADSRRIRGLGAALVLWIAPLLLGPHSDRYAELAGSAPHWNERLSCHVLDPRLAEVREHLATTAVRLVTDYDLAGLKIDFLEQAMVYKDTPPTGDVADIGQAMAELLGLMRSRLDAAGRTSTVFEFRQPYVNPAIARFGQILRAGDCPADAVVNRRSTVDARLFSVGQVVHSDPMMWGPDGGVWAVAQQLYGGFFAVPQISMHLGKLPEDQSVALAQLLELWSDWSPVLLDGELTATGSELGYPVVRSRHLDLGSSVVARYAPVLVDLGEGPGETLLVNATPSRLVPLQVPDGTEVTGGEVRDASGTVVAARVELTAGSGLVAAELPPYGTAVLRSA